MRDAERGKRLVATFLLGLLLLNFPLLVLVEASGAVLGLPALFLYVFAAWAGLILLLALIVERGRPR